MRATDVRDAVPQYSKTFRRSVRRYGLNPVAALRKPDPRWLFVVGSPRSGTTFTAESLGRVPGVVDLGEVPRFKAIVPAAYAVVQAGHADLARKRLAKVLALSARAGMGGGSQCLEQTPESTFVIAELAQAFPEAMFVHLIRDGRDVAASLVERGWLAPGAPAAVVDAAGTTADDAGQPYGDYARFWVEPERRSEFAAASEASRCAWAWRRYESAARESLAALPAHRVVHIRYEDLVREPAAVAEELAAGLGRPEEAQHFATAFAAAHPRSIGRFRTTLLPEQLADVEAEAGGLLGQLGYLED